MQLAESYARQVADAGQAMGLPFIAVAADIGSPEPLRGADGRPLAETTFRWLDPELRYWEDRGFALKAAFVRVARICSEPFHFKAGRFGSWRPNAAIEAIMREGEVESFGVGAAIVAPAYRPGGVIGAVVWATPDPAFDVEAVFEAQAADLHALAMKFVGSYEEATLGGPVLDATRLTRREIQCLKWAAAGKTDTEISQIVGISLPTVRFHITNASRRLGVTGRSRAVRHAAVLGYIGSEFGARPEA
ncbi:MAG TPA: LuxR C-terminal-related transcriptional regulator [Phenylobacterium sp.]|nr:LuxR C-terminal-related transcriptional regulator [Phenylobacterium sp.]